VIAGWFYSNQTFIRTLFISLSRQLAGDNSYNANLIIPVGTQVVTLVEARGRAGGRMCPRDAPSGKAALDDLLVRLRLAAH
jgi:hypothetical protein